MVSKTNGRKQRKQKSKGGKGSSDARSSQPTTDEHHNLSSPCCSIVEQIVKDIFPEAVAVESSSEDNDENNPDATNATAQPHQASLLGKIVRSHLLELRQNELQHDQRLQAVTRQEPSSPNKRKKRRKKKKGKQRVAPHCAPETTSRDLAAMTKQVPTTTLANKTQTPLLAEVYTTGSAISELNPDPITTTGVPSYLMKRTSPNRVDLLLDRIIANDQVTSRVPNRDLASFISFLSQRFQHEHRKQTRTNSKKKAKESNNPANMADILPSVQVQELQVACDSIGCRLCRRAAEGQLSSVMHCVQIRPSDIQPAENSGQSYRSIPVCGLSSEFRDTDNDMHFERAFDYVSMEEGGDTGRDDYLDGGVDATTDGLSLVLNVVLDSKGRRQLLQMSPSDDTSTSYPLTLKHVEDLIRCIILPCGLSEIDSTREFELGDLDLKAIQEKVEIEEPVISEALDKVGDRIRKVQRQVDGMETFTSFDVTSSSALMDCDATASELLEEMTEVLLQVSDTYHRLLVYHSGHSLQDFAMINFFKEKINALWRLFGVAIFAASREVLTHEGRVIQLSARPGSVPQMFVNASHRHSYREMLRKKLDAIASLNLHLVQILRESDPCLSVEQSDAEGPTLLTSLYTYEAFYFTTGNAKKELHTQNDSILKELSLSLSYVKPVLTGYTNLIQAVKCGSVSDLIAERKKRYQELRSSTMNLHKHIQGVVNQQRGKGRWNCETVEWTQLNALDAELDQLLSKFDREEISDETTTVPASDLQDGPAAERENRCVQDAVINVLAQWRLMTFAQARPENISNTSSEAEYGAALSCQLPINLRKWMVTRHAQDTANDGSANGSSCNGDRGGRRRVSCCISGLLYRWLGDRCMEWHAELAQHELLAAMDDGAVAGKKVKKKREKKPNTTFTAECDAAATLSSPPDDMKAEQCEGKRIMVTHGAENDTRKHHIETETKGSHGDNVASECLSLNDKSTATQASSLNKSSVEADHKMRGKRSGVNGKPAYTEGRSETLRNPKGEGKTSSTQILSRAENSAKQSKEVLRGKQRKRIDRKDRHGPEPQQEVQKKEKKTSPKSRRDKKAAAAADPSDGDDVKSKTQDSKNITTTTPPSPHPREEYDANQIDDAGVDPKNQRARQQDRVLNGQRSHSKSRKTEKNKKNISPTSRKDQNTSGAQKKNKNDTQTSGSAQQIDKATKKRGRNNSKSSREKKNREIRDTAPDFRVRVIDDYGTKTFQSISAEEFLVSRLSAVLEDANGPRESRGHDIVFM